MTDIFGRNLFDIKKSPTLTHKCVVCGVTMAITDSLINTGKHYCVACYCNVIGEYTQPLLSFQVKEDEYCCSNRHRNRVIYYRKGKQPITKYVPVKRKDFKGGNN